MKKNTASYFSKIVLAGISIFFCAATSSCDGSSKVLPVSSSSSASVVSDADPYEFRVLPFMVSQKEESTQLLSPYSLWQMGTLLWVGAEGETREELESLAFAMKQGHSIESSEKEVLFQISERSHAYRPYVQTALGLFVRHGIKLHPEFLSEVKAYYPSTSIEEVPFDTNPQESLDSINGFIEAATQGRLKNVVHSSDIDSETVSALVSTLIFKAEWQNKFDADHTYRDTFHSSSEGLQKCDMMQQLCSFRYYHDSGWTYVSMPFQRISENEEPVEFVFETVLPPVNARELTPEKFEMEYKNFFQNATMNASFCYLDFSMPKFVLRHRLDLKPLCEDLGIMTAFDDRANFGRMSSIPLVIQKIFQEVQLTINEVGTEVEAATVATARMRSSIPRPIEAVVRLDRPFFIIIRETESETPILFAQISSVQ